MSTRNLENRAAATGRAGSGGLVDELFRNYLALGDQFVNSAFQRQLPVVQGGQNAATTIGTGAANLTSSIGDINAAGIVGAANARAGGTQNLLNIAGSVIGGLPPLFGGAAPPPPDIVTGLPGDEFDPFARSGFGVIN